MGILRSVGGWGEVDLDQRAITTDDDIVDLSELDSHDQANQPAPATHNGAAEPDGPGEEQPPAAAISVDRTQGQTTPAYEAPGAQRDADFDRWVADRAPGLITALAPSKPSTPPRASDARDPASGDAPAAASGTAGVPCEEPTVPPGTNSRSWLRRTGPLSRPLGRLARPAAALGALTLTAGGMAIAINAAMTTTPHARPAVANSNTAAPIAGGSNRASDALSVTIAVVTSELHALARAVPPTRSTSHPPRKPRPHRPSHRIGISSHRRPAAVGEQSTSSSQTSPPSQTYDNTPAPVTSSSTSQATASSQTQATSRSQPAFGQNGSLGPGRGAPSTQ